MPLEPTAAHRPWVTVHASWSAFARRNAERSPDTDPPPTYAQAMGLGPAPLTPSGPSAIPLAVGNTRPAAQVRELQKLDVHIERTGRKLGAARDHLLDLQSIRAIRSDWFGEVCGSGLFHDDPSASERLGRNEVTYYEKKLQKLQNKRTHLVTPSADPPSTPRTP